MLREFKLFNFNSITIIIAILTVVHVHPSKANDWCAEPGLPVAGRLENSRSNYTYLYRVEYSCPVSHQLFGDKYRTCVDGVWTGNIPSCGTRMVVENATQSSKYLNHAASLAVDSNYTTCAITFTHNLFWAGEIDPSKTVSGIRITTPRRTNIQKLSVGIASQTNSITLCLETVGYTDDKSKDVEHLFLCPQNTTGKVVYVKRKNTTSTNSYQFMELCEVELFTTDDLPCRIPDGLKNGYRRSMFNSSSHYYIFTCNPGYKLVGNDKIYCTPNGSWSSRSPTCKGPITCSRPPSIANGYYVELKKSTSNVFVYNDSVEYRCEPGFVLNSFKDRYKRCVGDYKEWSGNPLFCQPFNGSTTPFEPSQRIVAKFTEISSTVSTTTKNDGLTTQCRNPSVEVNNGRLVYGNFTVSLECDRGYEPVGARKSTCEPSTEVQGHYQWKPPLNFQCNAVKAETNPPPRVAEADGKGKSFCPPPVFNDAFRLLNEDGFGGKIGSENFGAKIISEGTKIHVQCVGPDFDDKGPPVLGVTICTQGVWTDVHCLEIDVRSGKLEERNPTDSNSVVLVPVVSFLIGVGTAIVIIGVAVCLYVLRKSRLNGNRPSQSLFHINLTNSNSTSVIQNRHTGTNGHYQLARINDVPNTDEEHIYQIPAYEDVVIRDSLQQRQSQELPETPKRRELNSGLPLLPIYSQPFESDNYRINGLNSNVHIYAEPVRETTRSTCTTLDSHLSTESLNYLYAESRYSSIDTSDSVFMDDSNRPDLNMVDNDLYVSEDDSFQEF